MIYYIIYSLLIIMVLIMLYFSNFLFRKLSITFILLAHILISIHINSFSSYGKLYDPKYEWIFGNNNYDIVYAERVTDLDFALMVKVKNSNYPKYLIYNAETAIEADNLKKKLDESKEIVNESSNSEGVISKLKGSNFTFPDTNGFGNNNPKNKYVK